MRIHALAIVGTCDPDVLMSMPQLYDPGQRSPSRRPLTSCLSLSEPETGQVFTRIARSLFIRGNIIRDVYSSEPLYWRAGRRTVLAGHSRNPTRHPSSQGRAEIWLEPIFALRVRHGGALVYTYSYMASVLLHTTLLSTLSCTTRAARATC